MGLVAAMGGYEAGRFAGVLMGMMYILGLCGAFYVCLTNSPLVITPPCTSV